MEVGGDEVVKVPVSIIEILEQPQIDSKKAQNQLHDDNDVGSVRRSFSIRKLRIDSCSGNQGLNNGKNDGELAKANDTRSGRCMQDVEMKQNTVYETWLGSLAAVCD